MDNHLNKELAQLLGVRVIKCSSTGKQGIYHWYNYQLGEDIVGQSPSFYPDKPIDEWDGAWEYNADGELPLPDWQYSLADAVDVALKLTDSLDMELVLGRYSASLADASGKRLTVEVPKDQAESKAALITRLVVLALSTLPELKDAART